MNRILFSRRGALAASALLAILGVAAGLYPFYAAYLTADRALAGTLDRAFLLSQVLFSALAVLAKVGFSTLAETISHRAAYRTLYDLRMALLAKLRRVRMGFFVETPVGELKKALNEDVEQLEEVLAHAVPDLAAALGVPLCCAAALAFVDWRLALASVVMFPILVVVYPVTLAATKALGLRHQKAMEDLRGATIEYLLGMKVVRAFMGARRAPEAFDRAIRELAAATEALAGAAAAPGALMMVGLRANLLILLPFGGWMAATGRIDAGTFLLFLLMGLGVNASAYKLLMTAGTFGMRVATAGRQVAAVLAAPEIPAPSAPHKPEGGGVVFEAVNFSYDGRPALKDVSFVAPEGGLTAVVGPSGAGKTTLARLIGRFWDVDSGAIRIGGADLREIDGPTLTETAAFILQEPWLLNLLIRENIRSGRPGASDAEVERVAAAARVTEFAADLPLGLDEPTGEGGRALSGGQRQRVAIARALLRDAPVLVMDEATSALDPDTEEQTLAAMAELARGRTTIAVAHRLDTIRAADQILYLEEGRILGCGKHEELLASCPGYARLCAFYEAADGWSLPPQAAAPVPVPAPAQAAASEPAPDVEAFETPPAGSGGLRLFLGLLGPEGRRNLRGALPAVWLEGLFMGAPLAAAVGALLEAQAGSLTIGRVWLYTGFAALSFLLQGVFHIRAHRALWRGQTRTVARIQRALGERLRRAPLGAVQSRDVGELESLITQQVAELNFVTPVLQTMRAVVGPLVALGFMIWLDWRLALAATATLPLFFLAVALSDRIHARLWRAHLDARGRMSARLIEFIQGAPTLRTLDPRLGAAQAEAALRRYRDASLATAVRIAPTMAAGLAALDLGFCAILLTGGLLVLEGGLSASVFLVFLVAGLAFYGPIADAFELSAYRRRQERVMEKLSEVMAVPEQPEPLEPRPAARLDVEFDDVRFAYGGRQALRGLSLRLPAGGVYAFVGRSGSGKTTALALLARLWDVDSGAIRIGGTDLRDLSREDCARLFATVFQDVFLFDDSVAANLRIARPEATDAELIAAARAARCHEFVMALPEGYETRVGAQGARLSGGQRQRLTIARAILKDAPIILLDEAAAAIDAEAEYEIRCALAALCAGRTVIMAAHRLRSVRDAARLFVFEGGRLADEGAHEALARRSAAYRRLLSPERPAPLDPMRACPESS